MVKLSDTAVILSGVNPEPSTNDGCRFLQIRNLSTDDSDHIVGRRPTAGRAVPIQGGDVLLAARGERASAVQARASQFGAYVALDIYLIRPDLTRLDSDYLVAFLMRPATGVLLRKSTAGASLPRIPKDAIADLELPLPPLGRQKLIGGVASCIRRRRELADRLIAVESMLAEASLERVFAQLS
ncbi:hypothetical protein [uncultured Sphingomonas sp.]|uniref:hypothetical protein n=1 Tax=uncultured Sphingomonas sp. TaxID=158754 RepID=UPI0035CAFF0E